MSKATTQLKRLAARRDATILPGTPNAMFARVIENLGFEAIYVTGAGIANMELGVPDIGLTSLTEVSEALARIADVVTVPLLVDGDTGFGNPVNMVRTVRLFERAGAAGIQIEDQVFPKRCGHFTGKEIIPIGDMVAKLKAAADTRQDQDFQIVARTDARAGYGIEHAIDRAHSYVEAGADIIFVEAPTSEEEIRRIAKEIQTPKVMNLVHGGMTPTLPHTAYQSMGYSFVLYANAVLQATLRAATGVLEILRDEGSLESATDMLASFEERQNAVNKPHYDALEMRYAAVAAAHAEDDRNIV